jgi:hypothetical protein
MTIYAIKSLTINSINCNYIKILKNDKHDKIITRITKTNFKHLTLHAIIVFTSLVVPIIDVHYDEYI